MGTEQLEMVSLNLVAVGDKNAKPCDGVRF